MTASRMLMLVLMSNGVCVRTHSGGVVGEGGR